MIPKRCGDCEYYVRGFLSEPGECQYKYNLDFLFVKENQEPTKWCPLRKKMNIYSLIKIATNEAKRSEHRQRMGAVIYNKNIIISRGYNQPFRSVRSATFRFFKRNHSVHAEVDAILKAKCDLKGTGILVVRLNPQEELRNAKPCEWCQSYIEYVGIKTVIYTLNTGVYEFYTL